MDKPLILLTNDDGIASPGLWAAAQALAQVGYVQVVAPRQQSSGAGRSLAGDDFDGTIRQLVMQVNGQDWQVYSVHWTPAGTVLHAVLEILPERPDLVVSGINFGENLGTGITISGTVGAALEAAALGLPALAVSLETEMQHHYSHSDEVDFSVAAHFTACFARLMLSHRMPADVDVLKVDIPCDASPDTPWRVTRVSRRRYFEQVPPERASWDVPGKVGYRHIEGHDLDPPDTDVHALRVQRIVSVTPLSLDMTSRLDLGEFERQLRGDV